MAKNDNYEISDSLWGRITQYASAVWDSWGKDVDEYVKDVMDTDSRSDEEYYVSTVLQDSAHSVELVAHLVGSVFSNDYTKERMRELGSLIESTDAYNEVETHLKQASEQFMKEHPKVQTALMAAEDKLEEAIDYVTKEAKEFSANNPEISRDLQSMLEIAMTIPVAKAGTVVVEAREFSKLNKLDYDHTQGNELAKGIPSEVDKESINLEKLAVTAEAKVGNETLFDSNQQARVEAYPKTPTLSHDAIREKEAKNIAKVERKIERKEKEGNPLTDKEKEEEFYKANKPNATLDQSHAETALIQRAFEKGLTKDADMFIKVNGKAVCGHCNSDTIAMAKESGLKSITIYDYNVTPNKHGEILPVLHWNSETGRQRFESFEALEEKFPDLSKAPDYIKHAGVIEAERLSMNKMDMVLLGAGGVMLMIDSQDTMATTSIASDSQEKEPFDSTAYANDFIDKHFPVNPTQENYDYGLPDNINAYLDQFRYNDTYSYNDSNGMERD